MQATTITDAADDQSIFVAAQDDPGAPVLGSDCKIFVGNLPFRIDEQELKRLFAPFGQVIGINLRKDRTTGKPKGFGFVTYSTPEEAIDAIHEMNMCSYEGRCLSVGAALKRGTAAVMGVSVSQDTKWMTVPAPRPDRKMQAGAGVVSNKFIGNNMSSSSSSSSSSSRTSSSSSSSNSGEVSAGAGTSTITVNGGDEKDDDANVAAPAPPAPPAVDDGWEVPKQKKRGGGGRGRGRGRGRGGGGRGGRGSNNSKSKSKTWGSWAKPPPAMSSQQEAIRLKRAKEVEERHERERIERAEEERRKDLEESF